MIIHEIKPGGQFRLGASDDIFEVIGIGWSPSRTRYRVRCIDEDRNKTLCREFGGGEDFLQLFSHVEVKPA